MLGLGSILSLIVGAVLMETYGTGDFVKYEVLKREKTEYPGIFKLEYIVLAKRPWTKEGITKLNWKLYEELRNKHDLVRANHVQVLVLTKKDHAPATAPTSISFLTAG